MGSHSQDAGPLTQPPLVSTTAREAGVRAVASWAPLDRLKLIAQQALYRNWTPETSDLHEGYTLLLLVPGDLPVFLKLAARMMNRRASGYLLREESSALEE